MQTSIELSSTSKSGFLSPIKDYRRSAWIPECCSQISALRSFNYDAQKLPRHDSEHAANLLLPSQGFVEHVETRWP